MLSILLSSFTLLWFSIHLISIYLSETIKTVWAGLVCFCSIIRTTPPCDTITVSQVPSPLLFILYFAETIWARLVRFYSIDEYLLPVIQSLFTDTPTVHNKKHSIHFNLIFINFPSLYSWDYTLPFSIHFLLLCLWDRIHNLKEGCVRGAILTYYTPLFVYGQHQSCDIFSCIYILSPAYGRD